MSNNLEIPLEPTIVEENLSLPPPPPTLNDSFSSSSSSSNLAGASAGGGEIITSPISRLIRQDSVTPPKSTVENNSLQLQLSCWEKVDSRVGSIIPCKRSLHSGAIWRDNIIIFGGYDGLQRVNDLHFFNFTNSKWSIIR